MGSLLRISETKIKVLATQALKLVALQEEFVFIKFNLLTETFVAVGLKSSFPGLLSARHHPVPRRIHIPSHSARFVFKPATSMLNPSHTFNLSDFYSATNWRKLLLKGSPR